MERFRLTILVESRIRWKVYVRFGGEYWETYHRNMTRRRVLSLHNQTVKAIHTNFNDRRAVALLSRLEKSTRELTALEQQVIDLTRELKSKWSHE
ncbi:plasmid mobilization protein [Alistipes shahii]|uniref:plasmid mobilization protein n=2 Tax=Alistipes shahii TaxID=328814 RepID=UPI0034A3C9E7